MPCNIHYETVSKTPNFFPSEHCVFSRGHVFKAAVGLHYLPYGNQCIPQKDALVHIALTLGRYLRPKQAVSTETTDIFRSLDPNSTGSLARVMHIFMQRQYEYHLCVRAISAIPTVSRSLKRWGSWMTNSILEEQETPKLILKYISPTQYVYPNETGLLMMYERHEKERALLFEQSYKACRHFRESVRTGHIWVLQKSSRVWKSVSLPD